MSAEHGSQTICVSEPHWVQLTAITQPGANPAYVTFPVTATAGIKQGPLF